MLVKAVDQVLKSLEKGLSIEDFKLYVELEKIQDFISQAKDELRSIQPLDSAGSHIPTAKDELFAVAEATQEATNTILDSAEAIENQISSLDPALQEIFQDHVTRIYEACNFQDITGQRIKKVTNTLKQIDEKIGQILKEFKPIDREKKPVEEAPQGENYLNGPQLPQSAKSQEDIDALFTQ
jgi:chemotaxis protein CheZ